MLKKNFSKTGKSCRVTFKIPATTEEDLQEPNGAVLLGDFNSWDPEAHPMVRRKDGTFSVTVSLDAGKSYRFRYLLDGDRWANDDGADSLAPNPFGSQDSVLSL